MWLHVCREHCCEYAVWGFGQETDQIVRRELPGRTGDAFDTGVVKCQARNLRLN